MNRYQVTYSARRVGATGIFYPVTVIVSADSEGQARDEAFDQLHRDDYETNHPIKIRRVE